MEHVTSYRTYWILWVVLLGLTLTMIGTEAAGLPRVATVGIIVLAMTVKVATIGAWYMHLRYERLGLILAVALGTFVTAGFLFFLLVPDGIHMHNLAQ
jgi:cytochrome c oxidase subunit IV